MNIYNQEFFSNKAAGVNRADLIRCIAHFGQENIINFAETIGYSLIEKSDEIVEEKSFLTPIIEMDSARDLIEKKDQKPVKEIKLDYWLVKKHRKTKLDEIRSETPSWVPYQKSFENDSIKRDHSKKISKLEPLIPWSRLWPFIRSVIGTYRESKRVDIPKVIDLIVKNQPIKDLPKKPRKAWSNQCQIIMDTNKRLLPFRKDRIALTLNIRKLRGTIGLELISMKNGPFGKCRRGINSPAKEYKLPEAETPILLISDLGCLDKDQQVIENWKSFGLKLNQAGFRPFVFMLCPKRLWDRELTKYWDLVCLDRGEKLSRLKGRKSYGFFDKYERYESDLIVEKMLNLISISSTIEPELLRAIRLLLPLNLADISLEHALWSHKHTVSNGLNLSIKKRYLKGHQKDFFKEDENLQKEVRELVKKFHSHLSRAVTCREEFIYEMLTDKIPGISEEFFRMMFKTLDNPQFFESKEMIEWFDEFSKDLHESMWENPIIAAIWGKINIDRLKRGEIDLPVGLDLNQIRWLFEQKREKNWIIRRKGENIIILENNRESKMDFNDLGSPLTDNITSSYSEINCQIIKNGFCQSKSIPLDKNDVFKLKVPSDGKIIFKFEKDEFTLESVKKPGWSAGIGRDQKGLFVIIPGEKNRNAYWAVPQRMETSKPEYFGVTEGGWWDEKVYLYHKEKYLIDDTNKWADFVERDQYGIKCTIKVKGVTFCMRWIEPCSFKMGSPENEPERMDRELLHEVILTKGYWLADTACTQELWKVVMGKKPSYFKGVNKPVEQVSWDDCLNFIEKINKIKPGLNLRLPTEAEWENACRAGTETPFSFGEDITPEQVNYYGNYPYKKGKKGIYREETVPVKSLPCNDWGLYEMHGNVWEWCQDWYGDYPGTTVIDPKGPAKGDYRVIRGGSWNDVARNVRSAVRDGYRPGYRNINTGFRLARGHERKGR